MVWLCKPMTLIRLGRGALSQDALTTSFLVVLEFALSLDPGYWNEVIWLMPAYTCWEELQVQHLFQSNPAQFVKSGSPELLDPCKHLACHSFINSPAARISLERVSCGNSLAPTIVAWESTQLYFYFCNLMKCLPLALPPRDQPCGLCAVPGSDRHHGGCRARVDSAGEVQHRVPQNIPPHLCLTAAEVSSFLGLGVFMGPAITFSIFTILWFIRHCWISLWSFLELVISALYLASFWLFPVPPASSYSSVLESLSLEAICHSA